MFVRDVPKDVILLDNRNIPKWNEPPKPGVISVNMLTHAYPEFHTRLVKFTGLETFSGSVGHYLVHATAARYHAVVPGLPEDRDGGPKKFDFEHSALFDGGIEIYRNGILAGPDVEGNHFLQNGRIWYAIPLTGGFSPTNMPNLRQVLLGTGKSTRLSGEKRIEEILRGYEFQEDSKRQRERDGLRHAQVIGEEAGERRQV